MTDRFTLGWFLDALRPEIPQSLLSGSGLERVLVCASRLPLAAAVFPFGLEIRLDEAEPAADFALAVVPGSSVSAHFRRLGSEAQGAHPQAVALGWLLGELERPDSFLSRVVGLPMLEYDLIESGPNRPPATPGLFLKAADDLGQKAFCNPGVMLAALACAAGMDEDAGERRTVERIFVLLPADEARVVHAGTFPTRRPRGLRLVIAFKTMGAAVSFLRRVGWAGSLSQVDRIATVMEPLSSDRAIGLDIGPDGLGCSLGLEWRPEKGRMEDALDWLVAEGLCLPAKADGLRAFPGSKRFSNMHILLNAERKVSHVKITLRGTRRRAKAYMNLQATADAAG